tara:strand:- start:6 stop:287 length:282 start_codon:yes stop_codon:yes gene_type:complete
VNAYRIGDVIYKPETDMYAVVYEVDIIYGWVYLIWTTGAKSYIANITIDQYFQGKHLLHSPATAYVNISLEDRHEQRKDTREVSSEDEKPDAD